MYQSWVQDFAIGSIRHWGFSLAILSCASCACIIWSVCMKVLNLKAKVVWDLCFPISFQSRIASRSINYISARRAITKELISFWVRFYYLSVFIRFTKFVSELSRDSIGSKLRKIPERRKIYNSAILRRRVLAAKGNPCKIISQGRKTSLISSNASCTCSIER